MKTSGIERGTLSAFEDFLCALIRGSFDVTDVLKDNGVISVCQVWLNIDPVRSMNNTILGLGFSTWNILILKCLPPYNFACQS